MRGKLDNQVERWCEFCGCLLPEQRHPDMRYCTVICRERDRYARNNRHKEMIKCLDCGKSFVKVGAHVVQVHGYPSARDYRIEHGLDYKRGITTREHKELLAENARQNGTIDNLKQGAQYRFKKGDGRAAKIVSNYFKYKRTGEYTDVR